MASKKYSSTHRSNSCIAQLWQTCVQILSSCDAFARTQFLPRSEQRVLTSGTAGREIGPSEEIIRIQFYLLSPPTNCKKRWKKGNSAKRIFVSTFLKISSYSLILYVLMTQPVSYISAIRQFSVIFVVLLGGLSLGESQLKLRLISASTMIAGIFLIATAT